MGISQKTNPNILLTEVCNMNCAYCFAKETMMAPPKKEMSLADFERLLVFLKNNRQNEVRLMGGEPTLHSQFKEIVDLALSHSLKVKIFTNGFFSEDLAHWLANRGKFLEFVFNITAGAMAPDTTRKKIERNLGVLKKHSRIIGSVTMDGASFDGQKIVSFAKSNNIDLVRIGLANNRVGNTGDLVLDYKEIISVMMDFISKLKDSGIAKISLNCGFVPCMFTDDQSSELARRKIIMSGWGCAGKVGACDVSSDLTVFPCFVMESLRTGNIMDFHSLELVKKFSDELGRCFIAGSSMMSLDNCKKCPHLSESKCAGPCLGYVINNKKDKERLDKFRKRISFKMTEKILYRLRNISQMYES